MAARSEIKRHHKVWKEGMPSWVQAGTVDELFRGLPPDLVPDNAPISPAPRRTTPPPLEAPASARIVPVDQSQSHQEGGATKKQLEEVPELGAPSGKPELNSSSVEVAKLPRPGPTKFEHPSRTTIFGIGLILIGIVLAMSLITSAYKASNPAKKDPGPTATKSASRPQIGERVKFEMRQKNDDKVIIISGELQVRGASAFYNESANAVALLVVQLSIENTGKVPIHLIWPESTFIKDSEGRVYQGQTADKFDGFLARELGPSLEVKKSVVFKVPPKLLSQAIEFGIGEPSTSHVAVEIQKQGADQTGTIQINSTFSTVRAAFRAID